MRLGEVGLLTNDVVRLSDFYKALLETDNGSKDKVHQTIIGDETMLTVYNDGYQRVLALGAEVIEKPTRRPWGAVNMSFYDPDRNVIYLRSFSADSETMG